MNKIMGRTLKVAGFVIAGTFVLATIGIPMAIGIRPIIGARVRPLTARQFDATPARLSPGFDSANQRIAAARQLNSAMHSSSLKSRTAASGSLKGGRGIARSGGGGTAPAAPGRATPRSRRRA